MPTKPLPAIFESRETVNERVSLYMAGKHPQLTAAMQLTDDTRQETRWVWYSKSHIQTWLEEMEDLEADGMRIYFGEKEIEAGDELDLLAQAAKASGQLCLIMVLTCEGTYEDSHINIVYEDLPDFEDRQALTLVNRSSEKSKQFNFGGYSPPKATTEGDDYPDDSLS